MTIISGAIAERIRFAGFLAITIIISGCISPFFGHWAWYGINDSKAMGWLYNLGFFDFAGSTVVHSVGGWVALAVLLIVGPRSGRYNKNINIQTYNMPLVVLGVFLLWIGWFGFNGGSTLGIVPETSEILINTVLSGLSGGLAALGVSWLIFKRPHAAHILNGALTGLVGITANCNIVTGGSSLVIGGISGVIYIGLSWLFDKFQLDDVVYAVPVHVGGGIWGTLAVALFGNPIAWEFGRSRWEQLAIQAFGVSVCFIWAFGVGFVLVWVVNRFYPLTWTSHNQTGMI